MLYIVEMKANYVLVNMLHNYSKFTRSRDMSLFATLGLLRN